jgi:crotonobetainyl-CoA:carnitine CoA-transferase CaiB-like acyl-CoA transferase
VAGPLKGLRVLDLSRILAGPWASQCLADLGAEVIKIERPEKGDDTRAWGPPFFGDREDKLAAYYLSANRGKLSVALDISSPEGQEIIRQLAAECDILVENFKVGGLKRYGLDYESLKAVNPGLIYCSITGFGQTGPYKDRPGYDLMIQAMGGLMSITGEPDNVPGGGPLRAGVAVTDLFTGLYSVIGILGALHHREKTGEGQHIDMALLDTQVAVLANQSLTYLVSGKAPERQGNSHPAIVPYQSFATKDGHMILAVGNDSQFKSFCSAAGIPALADDERFATNPARVANRTELVPIVEGVVKGKTTDEWVTVLEQANVPCGPINTIDRVFANEQVRARGVELSLKNAEGKPVPGVANPIRYSATPIAYEKAPPRVGEDTEAVLERLLGQVAS